MNIPKKLITTLIFLALSYSSSLYAHNDAHTFYGGYIYSKITGNTAHGAQLSYRYESDNTWGLLASLLHINSNREKNFSDGRFPTLSILEQKYSMTSVLIGPTYRINSAFSIYAQMGPVKIKYNEDKHHPFINTTDDCVVNTSNYLAQGGIDYNPIEYISINMGYLYSDATVNKRRIKLDGIQLSLGYRF
ncbi:Ail/Lom family outer membrane beta-barrel protein [Proteus hauseri]|uniref:Ail/Lom family outer membrane beta-barrel protein n=1 Tax=Proteus hauseri TaxID=183417 RepID=UPI0032DAB1CD